MPDGPLPMPRWKFRSGYDGDMPQKHVMKTVFRLGIGVAVLAIPALPQSAELGISGGYGVLADKSLGIRDLVRPGDSEEYTLSNGIRIGARMAFNSRAFIGHELAYSYQRASLGYLESMEGGSTSTDFGTVNAHHMYYNLVAHATPTETVIRPFVTGGGGFSSFFLPGVSAFSGRADTKFGYNYGGGIKLKVSQYGIRFDVRNHVTGKPFSKYLPGVDGKLNNLEFSMTFSVLL